METEKHKKVVKEDLKQLKREVISDILDELREEGLIEDDWEMKIKLKYMVDPDELKKYAKVENSIRIVITKPSSEHLKNFLGESGRTLAKEGISFLFERQIGLMLIELGVAREYGNVHDLNKETWDFWDNEEDAKYDKKGDWLNEMQIKL